MFTGHLKQTIIIGKLYQQKMQLIQCDIYADIILPRETFQFFKYLALKMMGFDS